MSGLWEVVKAFLAERDGFITAINNCPASNQSDYHRWQGHAAARRVLGEDLEQQGVDLTAEPAPIASRERVAEVLREAGDIHPHIILSGWFGHAADALLAAGVFRDEATVKAEVAEQIAAKADEIAEGCSKSAADHRSIAIEIGSKLPKGRTHMATALAFSHQAAGAWAVAEAAREIGGTS